MTPARVTESGFVRVSSKPNVLATAIGVGEARSVLAALRAVGVHRFLVDDVSPVDADVPPIVGHRQVTDAQLLTLARRHGSRLVTFDAGVFALAGAAMWSCSPHEPDRYAPSPRQPAQRRTSSASTAPAGGRRRYCA